MQNTNNILNEENKKQKYRVLIWVFALFLGAGLGCLGISGLNNFFNTVATIFTRLFQFIAMPVIFFAVVTTLSGLGAKKDTGKIFAQTLFYTLITTFLAALIGLLLYKTFAPENISQALISRMSSNIPFENFNSLSYGEYLLSIIPNNPIQPFVSANVLSVIIIAAALGLGLSFAPNSENKEALIKVLYGMQELLFTLIRGLLKILPFGIAAFSAQLSAQIVSGSMVGALGKYTLIVLCGNLLQMFVVLPVLLLIKGLNPVYIFKKMSLALLFAFFTKSSAGTLPVTLSSAEKNLNINPKISRFVLPICTTINMNGCAAFILITSLFVMQNAGFELSIEVMLLWLIISVFAAIGNAGVPMGCYFLTLSLMSSIGAPLGLLGVILPIYAVIDMVETVENVWSDSVVCAIVNKDLAKDL